jgi:hypothetical protein
MRLVSFLALPLVLASGIVTAADDAPPAWSLNFLATDNVELDDTAKLIDLNGSFTIELWAKFGDEKKTQRYFFADHGWKGVGADTEQPSGSGFRLEADRRLNFFMANTSKHFIEFPSAPLDIKVADKFHHYAVVKNEDRLKFFVDGKLYGNKVVKDRFANYPSNLFLGVRANPAPEHKTDVSFQGFRISDGALYDKEFKPPVKLEAAKETLLLLDFAGPGETKKSIRDISGNAHHGTIDGAKWVKVDDKEQPKK